MNQNPTKSTNGQAKKNGRDFTPEQTGDALWRRRWTVVQLAKRIRYPRETVSKAINQGRFPRVRKEIARVLGL